jgi:hypothetical protein
MGLKPGSGAAGLKSVGNTMTNIGVPMDSATASKMLSGIQTNVGGYLSGLTTLLPTSVTSALKPFLGSGSGPFGNPSMTDMLGSASGKHTADFSSAGNQLNSIASSTQGQGFATAMSNLMTAITSGSGISAALSAFTSATSSFNASALTNSSLSGAMSSISGSMSNVTSHISLENSNLSLAGLNLSSVPVPGGVGSIMSFASKLHSFGVDKMQLGHADVFNGVATDDLHGDAMKAALLEGKNVAAMAGAGKSPTTVSNTQAALTNANASNIGDAITAFEAQVTARNQAVTAANEAKSKFVSVNKQYQADKTNAALDAQWDVEKANCMTALEAQTAACDAYSQALTKLSSIADASPPATQQQVADVMADAQSRLVAITRLTLG